jgi:hypothetical protein
MNQTRSDKISTECNQSREVLSGRKDLQPGKSSASHCDLRASDAFPLFPSFPSTFLKVFLTPGQWNNLNPHLTLNHNLRRPHLFSTVCRHPSNSSLMDVLQKSLKLLTTLLIIKIIAAVLLSYRDYMPPNFDRGFLIDRDPYFFGGYQWAFYAHVTSGPLSLMLGLVLLSKSARLRSPKWHRFLGRIQTANILLLVTPSGLWMSRYAESGLVAGLGFGTLSIVTGMSVALGWRAAVQRRFQAHQIWMERCFALLCSAVVLRFIGGAATLANVDWPWVYPVSAWISWLLPLAGYELYRVVQRSNVRTLSH